MVQWAAKVLRHRRDLCSHGIDQGHRQVNDLSKLRWETARKGLVDQAQSVVTQVSVELAILDVGAEVQPVEVVAANVATEENRLDCSSVILETISTDSYGTLTFIKYISMI